MSSCQKSSSMVWSRCETWDSYIQRYKTANIQPLTKKETAQIVAQHIQKQLRHHHNDCEGQGEKKWIDRNDFIWFNYLLDTVDATVEKMKGSGELIEWHEMRWHNITWHDMRWDDMRGHLYSPQLTSSHFTSPHLSSPHLISPLLSSPHLSSSHLSSHHLTSPLLILSHITSPQRVQQVTHYSSMSHCTVSCR